MAGVSCLWFSGSSCPSWEKPMAKATKTMGMRIVQIKPCQSRLTKWSLLIRIPQALRRTDGWMWDGRGGVGKMGVIDLWYLWYLSRIHTSDAQSTWLCLVFIAWEWSLWLLMDGIHIIMHGHDRVHSRSSEHMQRWTERQTGDLVVLVVSIITLDNGMDEWKDRQNVGKNEMAQDGYTSDQSIGWQMNTRMDRRMEFWDGGRRLPIRIEGWRMDGQRERWNVEMVERWYTADRWNHQLMDGWIDRTVEYSGSRALGYPSAEWIVWRMDRWREK